MKIALVGNPNAGKSSLFNHLTGLRQSTGNFPGVTVDKHAGTLNLPNGETVIVIDLPGAYSLYPNSTDERIISDILCDQNNPNYPDAVIYVADVNHLERHLLLCSQLIDLEIPAVLVLTMNDIAEAQGIKCDSELLSQSLDIPVVKINGRTGSGIRELLEILSKKKLRIPAPFLTVKNLAPSSVEFIKTLFPGKNKYAALLVAHHFKRFGFVSEIQREQIQKQLQHHSFSSLHLQVQETMARFDKIAGILKNVITLQNAQRQFSLTEKIDRILTHKIFGSLIFLSVLFLLFQAIFSWASLPMELIDKGFGFLSAQAREFLPKSVINDLFANGIIPGLAGICIFIPQIAILFMLIVFLEDVGYMSRAIFLSDSIMRRFGLNGRSIVSLFSGIACAVPAIMATRSISNRKERLITILVTPLVSCSARIPVFTILIALAIPKDTSFGIFNAPGVAMMGLYMIGVIAALAVAFVLKLALKTQEHSYLIMELPSYKAPHWRNIALTVWDKVKIFVTQAGKVIIVISIVLWFLSSYGPREKMEAVEKNAVVIESHNLSSEEIENQVAARKMEASFAGHLGRGIEPLIAPLGFDWKIGIAIITSFAAREVFIGTVATLYSIGGDDEQTVLEKLRTEKNPSTGLPVFTPAVAVSLLMFYLFAMQCMSTIAVVKRETGSWKWAFIQFAYMTGLAYLASYVAYQSLS